MMGWVVSGQPTRACLTNPRSIVTFISMKKIYRFSLSETQKTVSVDGVPLLLRRRRNEPEHYQNPDRLGLSILADCVGSDSALLHGHSFQEEVVNHCGEGEEISSDEIEEWNRFQCSLGASIQSAFYAKDGTEPPAANGTYLTLPRLLRVRRVAPSAG